MPQHPGRLWERMRYISSKKAKATHEKRMGKIRGKKKKTRGKNEINTPKKNSKKGKGEKQSKERKGDEIEKDRSTKGL